MVTGVWECVGVCGCGRGCVGVCRCGCECVCSRVCVDACVPQMAG